MPIEPDSGLHFVRTDTYLGNLTELGVHEQEGEITGFVCSQAETGERLKGNLAAIQVLQWPGEDAPHEASKVKVAYVWSEGHGVLFLLAAFPPDQSVSDLTPWELSEADKMLLRLIWWVATAVGGM